LFKHSRRSVLASLAALSGAAVWPGRARAADIVRVASVPSDGGLELAYGAAQGFAARQNLTPQVTIMGNGAAMIAATLGGDMDVVMVNMISILQAHEKGVPLAMIAPGIIYTSSAPQEVLMVQKASPLRAARDLEGKLVGVDGLRNSTQLGTMAWMERNGADPASVKWVELPFPAMAAALTAGRIDASLMTEPYATQAKDSVRILGKAFDAIAPQFCLTGWVASRAWTAAHADETRRFAALIYQTAQWANRNQKATAQILVQSMHLDPEVVATMPRAAFAEKSDPALVKPIVDVAVKYGVLGAPASLADLLAPELAR
jgi:NitT/TauT family transport system substrate-binding protein